MINWFSHWDEWPGADGEEVSVTVPNLHHIEEITDEEINELWMDGSMRIYEIHGNN